MGERSTERETKESSGEKDKKEEEREISWIKGSLMEKEKERRE